MSEILGVGIIGCGNISSTYLQFAPLFKHINIISIADIAPEVAEKRATEFGVMAQSVAELLANPAIDIVVNLTIPEVHFEVTRDIVRAGKHAYSEKPFVLNLADGEALRELASRHNRMICSAPDTFLGGSHQQARQIIDNGEIGKITSGTCHLMSAGMQDWHPNPDFFFRDGGGPMLDMGPYYIANLVNFLGPVHAVTAMASTPQNQRVIGSGPRKGERVEVSTPTSVHGILQFENGALVTLATSWDVKAHSHGHMELYGSEGTVFLPDPNFFGGDISIIKSDGHKETVQQWNHPFYEPNQQHEEGMLANYRTAGLADMAQAILEKRAPRCALESSLHTVDVMVSILKSAETGRTQQLITTCEQPAPLGPDKARSLLV